ncbi:MAG: hypothetical protein K2M76_01485, partial [Muribaculaceae bacterium]|nr:hypothetical protein [Muribaculaceae bacterium]
GNAAIDKIRQWLILQKEAENWGTSITTTDAIASILNTGSRWTVPATGTDISLGGLRLSPATATDSLTGYTTMQLNEASGKTLTIARQASGPAWGAVYSRFAQTSYEVKAAGCDAVKIDKRLLVARNSPDGVEWHEIKKNTALKVGDRVKVMLTVSSTRDMDYVAIVDERAAALEPVEQTPAPIFSEGLYFYRENRDANTRIMIDHMPKGTYLLSYEMWVNNAGQFSSGVASLQSQYAPQLAAHSSGSLISVSE